MLYFLLILLALLAMWKLLSHGRASAASLITGLQRLALVLAVAGAGLGGFIGYYAGSLVIGVAIGFTVVWAAAMVVIWIISGFIAK